MTIPALDRPLATTKQFREAVRRVNGWARTIYTDKPKSAYKVDNGRRNVLISTSSHSASTIEAVEFVLWAQGVTAHTRWGCLGLRGTCFLEPEKRQNV